MNFIKDLREKFELIANDENAIAQKAYMKNKFEFFGIYTKERDEISKEAIKNLGIISEKEYTKLVKELFKEKERDFDYVAIDIVAFHKKHWTENTIELIEYLITSNSWWDSVDDIASVLVAPYFKIFPQLIIPITSRWNKSENMWLQRTSIIFQNKYKQDADKELLGKYILHCKRSKEFFIQKAIGWSLREYGRFNPDWVVDFVEENKNELANLSKKEALRNINN
jgi:3-methyladenine DNA glycosylase AlkD